MPKTLLIIEDEVLLGQELLRYFRKQGLEVVLVDTLAAAAEQLFERELGPQAVLADMNLPDGNSLDLLQRVRAEGMASEWILLTGYGSIPDSVRALQLGALDFLEKPCPMERLDVVVNGALRSAGAQQRLTSQHRRSRARYSADSFVGTSVRAEEVRSMLRRLAEVPLSALVIGGETGTGKGLVARILHYSGLRADGPFVEVNCAALPRELLESELFGHEAGAFTGAKGRRRGLFEQADGGTLFLDEIGEMHIDLQSKLLKAIEDQQVRRLGGERVIPLDVQVITASNRDLEACVQEGTFRSDLYHRLSVFQFTLPPLRSRSEDLEQLVPQFVAEYNQKANRRVRHIPEAVWQRLRGYRWPGNVRELRNVIERCVLLSDGEAFPEQWLQLPGGAPAESAEVDGAGVRIPMDGSMALEEMEAFIIRTALERHDFNVTATARALGTTRETLRYRTRKYGLRAGD